MHCRELACGADTEEEVTQYKGRNTTLKEFVDQVKESGQGRNHGFGDGAEGGKVARSGVHFRTMNLDVQRAEDVACLRGQGGAALPLKLV